MFLNKIIRLLLLLLFTPIISFAQITESPLDFLDDSVSYLWPTNASTQLSSTFGETRSAHLHAGIDIRTWGREGYRVFASRDGIISRIGIGPHGYGHVIYMRHGDDSYTVYAHLNRFEPELQAFADSIRLIDYTYEIDLDISEYGFQFKQGDVIGYSGSTGVGPPHLHFEVRNPDFVPVNPLHTNLSIRDSVPPEFVQLAIEKLDPASLKRTGHSIYPVKKENGGYSFGDISVSTPVGLAVRVQDQADQAPNIYAVHSVTLMHEADTLFHSAKDAFSFSESRQMFLDRSYPLLAQTRRGFQRLYRVSGNNLTLYSSVVNEGILWKSEGEYPIRMIASDIFGNQTEATFNLKFEGTEAPSEPITYVPAYPDPDNSMDRLTPWRRGAIPLSESLLASAGPAELAPSAVRQTDFRSSSRRSVLTTLEPGRMRTLHTPDQKLWIQFPSDALYDTLNLHLEIEESSNKIDISFDPVHLPLNRSIQLNYTLPERFREMNNLVLYSTDRHRDRERFVSSEISGGILRASLSQITDLRIKRDRTAPWVGRPRIEKNLGDNYIVVLPTVDRDAGIDYRRSEITVNGRQGIIEYDPEKDFLSFYLPGFKPDEMNEIRYSVYDRAGNLNSSTVQVGYSGL